MSKSITAKEFIWNSTPKKPIFITYENGTIVSRGEEEYRIIDIYDLPLTLEERKYGINFHKHNMEGKFHGLAFDYHNLDNGNFVILYAAEDKISEILKKYSYHIEMSVEKAYYRCCDMLVTKNYFKEGDEEKLIKELINLIR